MDTRYAVFLIVLITAVAGCTTGSSNGSPDQGTDNSGTGDASGSEPAPVSADVVYNSTGFYPQTVTVQVGGTVTWTSQGASMWVASDVHPSHTQYDGTSLGQHCDGSGNSFDSCGSQSEYSFTFEKTGEWSYHNHDRAAHGGTVVVK